MQTRKITVVFALFLLTTACGNPCLRVKQARERLYDATGRGAPGPHVEAYVPFALLDQEMTSVFAGLKPVKLALPVGGPLAGSLPDLTLVPTSLKVSKGEQEPLGLEVTFSLMLKQKNLVTLRVATDVQVVMEENGGSLELSVDGRHLKSVRPTLPDHAGKDAAEVLWRHLPKLLRTTMRRQELARLAQSGLQALVERDYSLKAAPLLKKAVGLVKTRLDVHALPMAGLTLRVDAERRQVVVGATLAMPVARTLPPDGAFVAAADRVAIRISGAALAALTNDAMAGGKLPQRYDDKGRPDPQGDFLAGVSFAREDRPLRIHLFREQGECVAMTLGGVPKVGVRNGKLNLGVEDVVVVDTIGSMLVKAGVWFRSLWAKALTFSQRRAATVKTSFAGRERTFTVEKAGYLDGVFRFDVKMD